MNCFQTFKRHIRPSKKHIATAQDCTAARIRPIDHRFPNVTFIRNVGLETCAIRDNKTGKLAINLLTSMPMATLPLMTRKKWRGNCLPLWMRSNGLRRKNLVNSLRIGSLFSGYGGIDVAVQVVFPAARPAWFVERDAAPAAILAHHWPDTPNFGDITAIDWGTVPPVDILTGGYPCQPFSHAGRRKGEADERHLWPYVREAIRHLRPRYVFLENVAGHRSLGFDRVLGDMAKDGLHAWWTSLRASDIGAPHHRERLFILAAFPDSESLRRDHGQAPHAGPPDREIHAPHHDRDLATDPEGGGPSGHDGVGGGAQARGERQRLASGNRGGEAAAHAHGVGFTAGGQCDRQGAEHPIFDGGERVFSRFDWGDYEPAIQRWEALTRPAPNPVEMNRNARPRLSAAFSEWMMGLPLGHVTGVPGLSRTAQLKAIGNGVCPQQAAVALQQLLAMKGG